MIDEAKYYITKQLCVTKWGLHHQYVIQCTALVKILDRDIIFG